MDVTEFWQENKRWILGCVLGLVVFFVGKSIIGSIYNPDPIRQQQRRAITGGGDGALYDPAGQGAADGEAERLEAELQRLRTALEFRQSPDYLLEGKGMPDDYMTSVGRKLRSTLTDRANELDVQLTDKELQWSQPVGVEEIRAALLGLDMIDAACSRLLSAHEKVVTEDPEARGVRQIQFFKVESRFGRGAQKRSLWKRGVRRADVDPSEFLREQRVSFSFQADAASTLLFLEALRDPSAPLSLEDLTITQTPRPGDPLTVKGKLVAILFRAEETAETGG